MSGLSRLTYYASIINDYGDPLQSADQLHLLADHFKATATMLRQQASLQALSYHLIHAPAGLFEPVVDATDQPNPMQSADDCGAQDLSGPVHFSIQKPDGTFQSNRRGRIPKRTITFVEPGDVDHLNFGPDSRSIDQISCEDADAGSKELTVLKTQSRPSPKRLKRTKRVEKQANPFATSGNFAPIPPPPLPQELTD